MSLSRVFSRFGAIFAVALMTPGIAAAQPPGLSGSHGFSGFDFHSKMSVPDGCRPPAVNDGTQTTPADMMKKFADEIGLSGQQQQDLQILTADYGERLRDLATLGRESAAKLAQTEPDDPGYWPLAQEVSATAATSSAEMVILISELREKVHSVLTSDQRAEMKRRFEERKARCKPQAHDGQPAP